MVQLGEYIKKEITKKGHRQDYQLKGDKREHRLCCLVSVLKLYRCMIDRSLSCAMHDTSKVGYTWNESHD